MKTTVRNSIVIHCLPEHIVRIFFDLEKLKGLAEV